MGHDVGSAKLSRHHADFVRPYADRLGQRQTQLLLGHRLLLVESGQLLVFLR